MKTLGSFNCKINLDNNLDKFNVVKLSKYQLSYNSFQNTLTMY